MEAPKPTYPGVAVRNSGKKKRLIILIIVIILLLAGAAVFFFQSKKGTSSQETTTTEETILTPTEKPQIDKKKVKIQVLNGTGTPGQAGTVVDALKDAGYEADNIKTDNAEEYDHTTTTISAKTGFEDIASDISDALKDKFDTVEVDSTPLASDSEFDVIITTGGKKFEESTSTTPNPTKTTSTTPTPTPTSGESTPSPTQNP